MKMDGFKINKKFAEHYDKYRRAEELQKLKDKYGDESDSSSESEDETAKAINPKLEKDFFRVLAQVKAKDPAVYKRDVNFFEDSSDSSPEVDEAENKKEKKKPLYMREYVNKMMEENSGAFNDERQDGEVLDAPDSYYGKLAAIKKSFTQATDEFDQKFAGDDDVDALMTIKPSQRDLESDDNETKLDELDDYWKDPKLNEKEKFLRDFILEKKYLESDSDDDEQFRRVNGISDKKEDEDFNEKQELFEYKFNTRFEHPDREFLRNFPRVIATSVRRKDDGKKKRRQRREKRKADEKKKKIEELARLKRLKREEIVDKINRLKTATGNTDINFSNVDIDGDFDPDDYDKKMNKLFNEEFYSHVDEEKPQFSDMEDDEYAKDANKLEYDECDYEQNVPDCERDDFIMDCDYVPAKKVPKKMKNEKKVKQKKKLTVEDQLEKAKAPNDDQSMMENYDEEIPECEQEDFVMDCDYEPVQKSKRQLKKERELLKANQLKQPVNQQASVTDEKSVSEHLQEYYSMEFDDLIGDMPCRFKYREVLPNDYGLTTTDILLADDATLNTWCPLKRVVAHRLKEEEAYFKKRYSRKACSSQKRSMFSRFYDDVQTKKKTSESEVKKNPDQKQKKLKKKQPTSMDGGVKKKAVKCKLTESNSNNAGKEKKINSNKKLDENLKKKKKSKIIDEKAEDIKPQNKIENLEQQVSVENDEEQTNTKNKETQEDSISVDGEQTNCKNEETQEDSSSVDEEDKTKNVESEKIKNNIEPQNTTEKSSKSERNSTSKKEKKNKKQNPNKKIKSSEKRKRMKTDAKRKQQNNVPKSNKASNVIRGMNKTRLAAYGLASDKYLSKKYYSVHLKESNTL